MSGHHHRTVSKAIAQNQEHPDVLRRVLTHLLSGANLPGGYSGILHRGHGLHVQRPRRVRLTGDGERQRAWAATLRCEAMKIAREQRCSPDIVNLDQRLWPHRS
jgi:hypothetical protein